MSASKFRAVCFSILTSRKYLKVEFRFQFSSISKSSGQENKFICSFFWQKLWLDNFVSRSTDLQLDSNLLGIFLSCCITYIQLRCCFKVHFDFSSSQLLQSVIYSTNAKIANLSSRILIRTEDEENKCVQVMTIFHQSLDLPSCSISTKLSFMSF